MRLCTRPEPLPAHRAHFRGKPLLLAGAFVEVAMEAKDHLATRRRLNGLPRLARRKKTESFVYQTSDLHPSISRISHSRCSFVFELLSIIAIPLVSEAKADAGKGAFYAVDMTRTKRTAHREKDPPHDLTL